MGFASSMTSPRTTVAVMVVTALAARIVANLIAQRLGFVAVSDDDFARVAIAQNFAHTPRWDASGSSWLPAPFWLTGGAMLALGTSFDVARGVAWLTSLASVIGFLGCGWVIGLRGRWLAVAGVWFAALPHAVWLGLATVPEGYTAVLAVAGICCLRAAPRAQLLGAVAVALATLCRYETWPIAVLAAGYHLAEGLREGALARRGALAATGLAGIGAWLLNGALSHANAWFFVKRVSDYRAAIGGTPGGWLAVLGNYPRALLVEEPVLTLLVLAVGALAIGRRLLRRAGVSTPNSPADEPTDPVRVSPALGCGAAAVLVFLVWGDVTNGAPTHHPERALLPVWLIAILTTALGLSRAYASLGADERLRRIGVMSTAALASLALGWGLGRFADKQFVNRSSELALGEKLGSELTAESRVWVETTGYGYTAVSVGSEKPWLVDGFNAADPRQAAHPPPFEDPAALAAYFAARKVGLVVVPAARGAALKSWALEASDFDQSMIFRLPALPAAENSEPAAD